MCDAPGRVHRPGATILTCAGRRNTLGGPPSRPGPTMRKPFPEATPDHDLATPLDDLEGLEELGGSQFQTIDPSLEAPDVPPPAVAAPAPRSPRRWAAIALVGAIAIVAAALLGYRA